ncbi:MAG: response regulator [Caulobacteraceae bacterium]|nr:response regulator [Caulobacter sp.]
MNRLDALLDALADPAPGGLSRADLLAAARREVAARDAAAAKALAAAKATADERTRFIAVLSHEIRTPLNGVLAVAELLDKEPLQPPAKGYARTVAESARTLLRILSDALELHRGEGPTGGVTLTPAPEPLHPLVDELEALWRPRAAAEGVRLHMSYVGDTAIQAVVDGVRLRQVLNNLLGNALKFAAGGGVELTLSAAPGPDGLRVRAEVRDTGPGLEPDMLERVFEPFSQTELGRAMGGAGLGLAVSRRIAEAMGGRLSARNNPGRGAAFTLDLLLAQASVAPVLREAAPAPADSQRLPRSAHVLVVDDNATNRMVAQTLCRIFGATSETAGDGLEAVELARSGAFDLILMDIRMPRMDGVEATRAIRALPAPVSATPILALTANVDPGAAEAYLAAGMQAVVEKPIQSDRLYAAMRDALEPSVATPDGIVRAA